MYRYIHRIVQQQVRDGTEKSLVLVTAVDRCCDWDGRINSESIRQSELRSFWEGFFGPGFLNPKLTGAQQQTNMAVSLDSQITQQLAERVRRPSRPLTESGDAPGAMGRNPGDPTWPVAGVATRGAPL